MQLYEQLSCARQIPQADAAALNHHDTPPFSSCLCTRDHESRSSAHFFPFYQQPERQERTVAP